MVLHPSFLFMVDAHPRRRGQNVSGEVSERCVRRFHKKFQQAQSRPYSGFCAEDYDSKKTEKMLMNFNPLNSRKLITTLSEGECGDSVE